MELRNKITSRANIFKIKVNWFRRMFQSTSATASPDKINNIAQEMRSLLQACYFNAKFTFDHKEGRSYNEITAPLREMLGKEEKLKWTPEREESYREQMSCQPR